MALVTALLALLAPLSRLDDLVAVNLLRTTQRTNPVTSVVRVKVSASSLPRCEGVWSERLRSAGAKACVLVEPLDELCRIEGSQSLKWSDVRRDAFGRAAGFLRLPVGLGQSIQQMDWVRPISERALPTMNAKSLEQGKVRSEWLRSKTVILTFEASGVRDERVEQVSLLLAAALEPGSARHLLPRFLVVLLVVGWAMTWVMTVEKRGHRAGLLVVLSGFSLLVFASAILAIYVAYSMVPMISVTLAFVGGVVTKEIPAIRVEQRALRRANQLVERAALIRLRGLDQLEDAEFHARLAGLAEQWHPANVVLIAQLPARKWHLKFWNNGSAGENLIEERRRDIRRTPYCDEQGVPAIRVVRNYLAVKEMPVLVVPLIALGEIEGYVFLCGDRAENAFRNDPTVAHRMSLELAMLMRRRRLGRATADELYDARRRSTRAKNMVAGAQTVTEEMDLLGAMVRDAPMGLLLTDAFGQVRMVGKLFHEWLTAFGVTLPAMREDAMLPAGKSVLGDGAPNAC